MKALAWLLLLFAAAVGVVWGASSNGGYVLLVLPQWRVELSLNFTILLLGVLFAVSLGVLFVATLFLGICVTFAGAAQAETVTIPRPSFCLYAKRRKRRL